MNSIYQKTLSNSFSFKGVGLHSGLISNVKITFAKENTGITFKRTDIKENNLIKADFRNVSSAKLCTTLKNSTNVAVSTIEHLMAAFYITGIDNAIVEIDREEVPIMDGSSKDFIEFINKAGSENLSAKRKFVKINKKISLTHQQKVISIEPSDFSLEVDFELSYKTTAIKNQKNKINFYSQNLKDLYSSRTFCLYEDIEKIKKAGLAKGGSLDNAIVIKDDKVMNKEGLRNENEFVNHKILDLAGDFMLSGYRIFGSVKCFHGGHQLSNAFLKEVFKDKSNFEVTTFDNELKFLTNINTTDNKIAVNA